MQQILSSYWDHRFKRKVIKLLPGDYCACQGEEMMVTVLGSCISACIFERKLRIGGMNHFMLPVDRRYLDRRQLISVDDDSAACRYGNVAMERLINEIVRLGGRRENMEVKIFGGAQITCAATDIGSYNIRFVRDYLHIEDMPIISEDVGGVYPRKVYYIPTTHEVFVKKIGRDNDGFVMEREVEYLTNLRDCREETEGSVVFLD